jgi:putative transcriptional regulator
MKKRTPVEIEFDADELIRRLDALAKHATGERPLTLRTTRLALPPAARPLKPREIAGIRKALGVSQAVFAGLLNVPKPTAISWERGARRPSGAALKLLHLAQKNPALLAAA